SPTVESWSFKIDHQLSSNTSLSIGYVGSHGYHELLSPGCKLACRDDLPGVALPGRLPRRRVLLSVWRAARQQGPAEHDALVLRGRRFLQDRKSTRLNSSHT